MTLSRSAPPRRLSRKREAALNASGQKCYSTVQRSAKPIPKRNAERQARRARAFNARLSRADWKALRLACFKRDGFRCTAYAVESIRDYKLSDGRHRHIMCGNRCPFTDDTMTGAGLVADHLTYARFGHELLSDLRTLCRSCNARLTKSERANHAQGFRKIS